MKKPPAPPQTITAAAKAQHQLLLTNMNSTFTFFLTLPGIKQATVFADSIFKAAVRTGPVPKHVAFIMDGNRRYAKNNKLPLEAGHSTGARNLVSVSNSAASLPLGF